VDGRTDAQADALPADGKGRRCIGIESLLRFSQALDATATWVDIVETYEVAGEQEIPRLDLGIYGDPGTYDRPADERRPLAASRLQNMVAEARQEQKPFVFEVWLDYAD
jgi:Mrp family chromosome partitioning ATPase